MKLEKEEWIETKIASPRAIKVIGYEFRKNEEFTMRDTNKESLRLKAEFKKNFFEEIKGNFTEEQLKYIDSTFDTITSKFKFSEKK